MRARRVALKARVILAWGEAPGLPVETACGLKKVLNNRFSLRARLQPCHKELVLQRGFSR